MRITIRSTPKRKKYDPKEGDKKTVKGVEYVRAYRIVPDGMPNAGARIVSNGRNLYEWVAVESVGDED